MDWRLHRERLENALLGLSVLSWAARGVAHGIQSSAIAAPEVCLIVLNAVVGGLILSRSRRVDSFRLSGLPSSLASVVLGGVALKIAPAGQDWPVGVQGAFAAGTVLACVSLLSLGRSFAVFPSVRVLRIRGPYGLVRHPAYLGELVMMASVSWAIGLPWGPCVTAVACLLIAARILAEERLLAEWTEYGQYRKHVPWRLIPRLW